MNLRDVISVDSIRLDLKAKSKNGIIEEMIDVLVDTGQICDRASALKAVLQREEKMSTGMQNGIAIPHGKCDTVDKLVALVCIRREPVDFQSLDGKPCSIFIMTLSPSNRTGPHIQFLAEVSRILGDANRRARLLAAQTVADAHSILSSD